MTLERQVRVRLNARGQCRALRTGEPGNTAHLVILTRPHSAIHKNWNSFKSIRLGLIYNTCLLTFCYLPQTPNFSFFNLWIGGIQEEREENKGSNGKRRNVKWLGSQTHSSYSCWRSPRIKWSVLCFQVSMPSKCRESWPWPETNLNIRCCAISWSILWRVYANTWQSTRKKMGVCVLLGKYWYSGDGDPTHEQRGPAVVMLPRQGPHTDKGPNVSYLNILSPSWQHRLLFIPGTIHHDSNALSWARHTLSHWVPWALM